ncbi:MAG: hypothetical protein WCW13_06195 [archaeon]|jgi:hypothetical protein
MSFMPQAEEFSCQEKEFVLYKSLCTKGKCLNNETLAFAKNFKQ